MYLYIHYIFGSSYHANTLIYVYVLYICICIYTKYIYAIYIYIYERTYIYLYIYIYIYICSPPHELHLGLYVLSKLHGTLTNKIIFICKTQRFLDNVVHEGYV